jgi:hypothetical protein
MITQRHQRDSAPGRSAGTADTAAALAAPAVTGVIGLFAEQVNVDEVEVEAALADTAGSGRTTVAATAAAGGAEQRQDGTGRQQLHVLPIELGTARCSDMSSS